MKTRWKYTWYFVSSIVNMAYYRVNIVYSKKSVAYSMLYRDLRCKLHCSRKYSMLHSTVQAHDLSLVAKQQNEDFSHWKSFKWWQMLRFVSLYCRRFSSWKLKQIGSPELYDVYWLRFDKSGGKKNELTAEDTQSNPPPPLTHHHLLLCVRYTWITFL